MTSRRTTFAPCIRVTGVEAKHALAGPPQFCLVVAGASATISGEFFMPFFVVVMNHEQKESSAATEISRKARGFLTERRIRRRFMPMKPMPTMPTVIICLLPLDLWLYELFRFYKDRRKTLLLDFFPTF
jgi:hypothetical protein